MKYIYQLHVYQFHPAVCILLPNNVVFIASNYNRSAMSESGYCLSNLELLSRNKTVI